MWITRTYLRETLRDLAEAREQAWDATLVIAELRKELADTTEALHIEEGRVAVLEAVGVEQERDIARLQWQRDDIVRVLANEVWHVSKAAVFGDLVRRYEEEHRD